MHLSGSPVLLLLLISFLFQVLHMLCSFFFLPMTGEGPFICFQLPARQEPVLDSSKYTAADVRIVSPFFFYLIYLSIYLLLKVTTTNYLLYNTPMSHGKYS